MGQGLLEVLLIFLAIFVLLLVIAYGVFSLFLVTMYRTLKMVRPRHRGMPAGLVWLCLIPYIGVIPAAVMVHVTSGSLRRQFDAIGESRPGCTYGLISGGIWAYGIIMAFLWSLVTAVLEAPDFIRLFSNLPLLAAFISWIVYWVQIAGYKSLLKRQLQPERTSEEEDYDDDYRGSDRWGDDTGP